MTREKEEAIKRLSDIRADYSCFDDDERPKYHALSMAIEALEAQQELVDATNEIYAKGYNAAKREIALSGEYERAYHRGKVDATKWIPVSERLPEKNGDYIVSLEDAVDTSASFFNGKWFMSSFDCISREYGEYEVIAWMPLPEPYKESDGE